MTKLYVVCVYADQDPGNVEIVGPFENSEAAYTFGENWQKENGDNPCWQTVRLPDGFRPTIIHPELAVKSSSS